MENPDSFQSRQASGSYSASVDEAAGIDDTMWCSYPPDGYRFVDNVAEVPGDFLFSAIRGQEIAPSYPQPLNGNQGAGQPSTPTAGPLEYRDGHRNEAGDDATSPASVPHFPPGGLANGGAGFPDAGDRLGSSHGSAWSMSTDCGSFIDHDLAEPSSAENADKSKDRTRSRRAEGRNDRKRQKRDKKGGELSRHAEDCIYGDSYSYHPGPAERPMWAAKVCNTFDQDFNGRGAPGDENNR